MSTMERLNGWLKGGTGRKVDCIEASVCTGPAFFCALSENRYVPYRGSYQHGWGDTAEAALADAMDKIGAPR